MQQTPDCKHLLFPFITSFVNFPEYAYNAGFKNPTEPLPILIRAAFKLEMKPATAGHDAEVPDSRRSSVANSVR